MDGVENVIAGLGDDLLVIDETEAAKDNSFSADLGDDRIEYQNAFAAVQLRSLRRRTWAPQKRTKPLLFLLRTLPRLPLQSLLRPQKLLHSRP